MKGTQHTLGLNDTENFGSGKNIEWNNMAGKLEDYSALAACLARDFVRETEQVEGAVIYRRR